MIIPTVAQSNAPCPRHNNQRTDYGKYRRRLQEICRYNCRCEGIPINLEWERYVAERNALLEIARVHGHVH